MKRSVVASPQALPRPAVEERFSRDPCRASPATSARAGKSPVARFRLSPAGNLVKCRARRPAAPPALLARSPLRRWTLWDRPSLSDRVRFPAFCSQHSVRGISRGMGRPAELVGHVSLACSLGNISPGCNHSWLLVSGAGMQWPRCKSNENAVFPCF